MTKLKLGPIADDKPVKVTLELPASLHRDLAMYAEVLESETGAPADAVRLIAPMLERFISTDRGFMRKKRNGRGIAPLLRTTTDQPVDTDNSHYSPDRPGITQNPVDLANK